MPTLTVDLSDEILDRFAEALALARARQTLADGGIATERVSSETAQADPWADDWPADAGGSQNVSETRSAPSGRQSAPGRQQQAGTIFVDTPKGRQRWTLGAANAPVCLCNPPAPAAYVEGKTNGRGWKRWTCALGASRDSWQNKCDFSQWA